MSVSNSLKKVYSEAEQLWKKGLNPTINVRLIPDDPTKLSLNYLEKDTTNANGDVNTDITITVSKPGPLKERNKEIIRSLKLTSKGYSSDLYFQNIENELKKLIKQFKKSIPNNYNATFDIYADDETGEQTKVYGEIYATPSSDPPTCNPTRLPKGSACSDIVTNLFTGNWVTRCNSACAPNTPTQTSVYDNCVWNNDGCENENTACA